MIGGMDLPWRDGGEGEQLREQVVQLSQEKRELQDYAERVTRELRRYQQARPPPAQRPEDDTPLPPWSTNMQMMSPLLHAYEERIGELETVIERSVSLAEQVQALTKENDALRVELHERTVQVRNQQVIAPFRELDDKEKPDEVSELYRLSVEQNEALAQQNQLLKLQVERMQQSVAAIQQQARDVQVRAVDEARTFTAEQERAGMVLRAEHERIVTTMRGEQEQVSSHFRTENERLAQELSSERERFAHELNAEREHFARELGSEREQSSQEREHLAHELSSEREHGARAYNQEHGRAEIYARQRSAAEIRLEELMGELVEEARRREQLEAQVEGLQQEMHHHLQSLDFYKKSFDDRCAMAGDEEERLQSDLARVSQNEKELRHRCARLERDLTDATDQLIATRREGDAMKQEAEQMLPLCQSMDSRLRDVSEKYKRAHAELLEKEGQVGDLMVARDTLISSEHTLKRQSERLENRMHAEIDALKYQRDQEVEGLRSSEKLAVSELEDRLRRSEQSAAELLAKAELSDKQRTWEMAAFERQSTLHSVERDRFQGDLEEMQQVRLRIERQTDGMQQEARRYRAEVDGMSAEVRERATHSSTEFASSRAKIQGIERSCAQTREEVQACEARLASAGSEQSRLRAELQEEQRRASGAVEQERQRAQVEQRGLEQQSRAVQVRARQEEQRAVELMHAQEALRQRWQAESTVEKDCLESEVERLSRENRSLKEKTRKVMQTLAVRRTAALAADDSFLLG